MPEIPNVITDETIEIRVGECGSRPDPCNAMPM